MKKRELMGLFKFLELQGYETDSLSKFIFNLKHENEDLKTQRQEFIKYLEKEIVDCKAGSGQQYYAQEHLKMFKEIIGGNKDE